MQEVSWKGYWAAAPTPYDSHGHIDPQLIKDMVDLYVSQGVHGILMNGTTGEWFSQSDDERRQVAQVAVTHAAGRIPVVVGCTAYTAHEVIELARHAQSISADGVLTTPPPYVHPSDEEILAFYTEVTQSVDMPWMAYNWPRGTAVDMSNDLLSKLADLDRIVAIKDSSGDELKVIRGCIRMSGRVRFFGRFIHPMGMAVLTTLGGHGNIDGGAVGAPFAVPYYEAVWRGDLKEARKFSNQYEKLTSLLVNADYSAKFASPTAQLKAAMRLLNQPGGYTRPPLLELDDPAKLQQLATALTDAGLTAHASTDLTNA